MALWKVYVNADGDGSVTGSGSYDLGDSVTITATPDQDKIFRYWYMVYNNEVVKLSESSTYTFTATPVYRDYAVLLDNDGNQITDDQGRPILVKVTDSVYISEIYALITDLYEFTITVNSSPELLPTPCQSATIVEEGESVTLKAREKEGYIFESWSTGATSNPYTFIPTSDIVVTAIYRIKVQDTSTGYYRAYIKDQTAINTLPKAFLTIASFQIRRDLITNATSKFSVMEMASNISNGDILVLYNPKGKVLYQGVITQIQDDSIQCSQIQSFYKGLWVYDQYPTETTLEGEFAYLLGQFAQGYIKGSSWQDTLIYAEKAPLKITTGSSTTGNLPTEDGTYDMEKFIYQLYQNYGIILDFTIPFGAWNIGDNDGLVNILIPNYSSIKIGNNTESIRDLTPVTEIEETNRLIIFAKDGTYRTTYVSTSTNGNVAEPSTNVGRYGVVNTKVVYSDDSLDDIVNANLPNTMFNHHLSFNLLLDNGLYDFNDFKLGMPLDVWNGEDYYSTVLTGYEITKDENSNPTEIKMICGKVRLALTKKLTMGIV